MHDSDSSCALIISGLNQKEMQEKYEWSEDISWRWKSGTVQLIINYFLYYLSLRQMQFLDVRMRKKLAACSSTKVDIVHLGQ